LRLGAARPWGLAHVPRPVPSPPVLAFQPAPEPTPPRGEPQPWRGALFASAVVIAVATTLPWVEVAFERLFGALAGPPGWRSPAGFTCLCTCLLVAIMALAETGARATHTAARPASLMLVAVAAAALGFEGLDGPGTLGGLTAKWTAAFWTVAASVPVLLAVCFARWAAAARAR
jgi:hypothetical protein